MSGSKLSGRAVVAMLLVLWKPVTTSSTPFVTQVASPGQYHDEPKTAESKAIEGFMEDIGFSSFFQDVGVEAAASSPSFTKIMPAASNHFPSVGEFNFDFGSLGEQTKEQHAARKEQGFMPTNPFGSSSNLASSNIAPPDSFNSEQSPFGGASDSFKFPAFETDFGFSGGFGSLGGGDQSGAKEVQKEKPAASAVAVEHSPRGKSASSFQPRYAQRRKDTFSDDPYQESRLYASPSKKEEKKDKGKCEVVHKDGMTCEICNDGHGGFSEHCSHSQNSGKDSKFTNTRKHTSDDVLKPKDAKPQAPAPAYQQSQQRRVQQKQRAPHGGAAAGGRSEHPSDPHAFDFSIPSSGSEANHQPQPNPQNPHNHHNSAPELQPVHHQQPASQQQYHPQPNQQQQQQFHHHHDQNRQTYPPQRQQQFYQPETNFRSPSAVEGPAPSHQNTHHNQAPQHAVAFQNHNQQHQQYGQQPQQGAPHVGPTGGHPSYPPQHGHHSAAPQPLQPQSAQQHDTQHNPNTYYSYQQPHLHQNRQQGTSYPRSTNNPVHQPAGSTNHHQEPPSIHHGSQPRTTAAPVTSDKLPPNYHRFVTVQKDEDPIVSHPSQESHNTQQLHGHHQQQPLHPQQQQYHHHHQQQQPRHQQQQSNEAVVHQPTPNQHQQQQLHQQPQQNYNQHEQQHHAAPESQNQQQEHPQQEQHHHHRSFSQRQQTHKRQPAPVSSHSPQENDSPSHYQSNEIQEIHSKDQNRKKFKTQKTAAPHHDDSNLPHDGGSSDHHKGNPKSSKEESHGGGGDGHRDEEGQSGDGDKKKNDGASQNDSSDSDFDFDIEFRSSFDSSPYAQSKKDSVYDKASDPFEGFGSDPYDHFAEGSNTDPYKFDIPEFDESEFNFGPEDHKKLVKKVGIHDEPKQTSNKKDTRVKPTDHRQQSGSQQSKVAEKNLGYKAPNQQENYKQLGQMVDQFGKKSRSNCKKEIRKSMTCYICPNPHGKTDEECMFASKDPHSQHMMYTEESSYGNPPA